MGDCLIRTGRLFQWGTIRLKSESLKREVRKDFGRRFRLVADCVLPLLRVLGLSNECDTLSLKRPCKTSLALLYNRVLIIVMLFGETAVSHSNKNCKSYKIEQHAF